MKKSYPVEFVFQLTSLILAIVLVHGFYVLVVRPQAETILAEQTAMMQIEPSARESGQRLVCRFGAVTWMLWITTGPGPWLVTVTSWAELMDPTA